MMGWFLGNLDGWVQRIDYLYSDSSSLVCCELSAWVNVITEILFMGHVYLLNSVGDPKDVVPQ